MHGVRTPALACVRGRLDVGGGDSLSGLAERSPGEVSDDPRLRTFASGISEQRRHSLRKPDRNDESFDPEQEREADAESGDQLSLFAAISAIPLDTEGRPLDTSPVTLEAGPPSLAAGREADEAIPSLVGEEGEEATPHPDDGFRLTPGFDTPVPTSELDPNPVAPSPRSRKRKLREQNSECVRQLVHYTRLGHAQINAELNRRAGIKRITEASADQLQRRLEAAEKWLLRG
jgi:hypothetical protein